MIPDGNNVYGVMTAPQGLEPVLRVMEGVVGRGRAYIYRSQFNESETLHICSDTAVFQSDCLGGSEHLFNGGVGGSLKEVVDFVRALSATLSRSGIEHSFEVYDAQQLVRLIPGDE